MPERRKPEPPVGDRERAFEGVVQQLIREEVGGRPGTGERGASMREIVGARSTSPLPVDAPAATAPDLAPAPSQPAPGARFPVPGVAPGLGSINLRLPEFLKGATITTVAVDLAIALCALMSKKPKWCALLGSAARPRGKKPDPKQIEKKIAELEKKAEKIAPGRTRAQIERDAQLKDQKRKTALLEKRRKQDAELAAMRKRIRDLLERSERQTKVRQPGKDFKRDLLTRLSRFPGGALPRVSPQPKKKQEKAAPKPPSPPFPWWLVGVTLGTGLIASQRRSPSPVASLVGRTRLASPVPSPALDPITVRNRQSSLLSFLQGQPIVAQLADPLRATTAASRTCEAQCERRRRSGKCREGFFKETRGRTRYKTWREFDCRTGKVTRRSK